MTEAPLIVARPQGLYCPPGDFYIDPWRDVDRAVITHAHGDHARPGHARLSRCDFRRARAAHSARRHHAADDRLWRPIDINGVRVSLHPAGHVLGSSQVRVEKDGARVGGVGRLQAQCGRDVPSVRARALRHVYHRVNLRLADLPLGRLAARCSPTSTRGGAPTRIAAAHRCCFATRSARRSGSCRAWTRASAASSCTARSSR